MKFVGSVSLDSHGEGYLGGRRIDLLEKIGETGSISQAARKLKISYKAAWDAVQDMNNLAELPLVDRRTGGRHGGGTRLTKHGRQTVELFRAVEAEYQRFLRTVNEGVRNFERFQQVMRRLAMKTSARNQFYGRIAAVDKGPVNARVVVSLGEQQRIVAVVTNASVEDMALEPGAEVHALVKASSIIVLAGKEGLRSSASNCLRGTVVRCCEGAVNGEVTIELAGGKAITAVITNDSIRTLDLRVGVQACALVKASSVILAAAL